jgi:hypothetical protein
VLRVLLDHNVVLKDTKCIFGVEEVEYLGHVVSGRGVRLNDSRALGVTEMAVPKNSKEVRTFLGFCGGFRKFVKGIAMVEAPLHAIAHKKKDFKWEDIHQRAFEQIKELIKKSSATFHLTYEHPIILRTDASERGVGAVLLQMVDGEEQPVVFVSKAFSDVATRWPTIEQEAYGVFYAITSLESYLLGHEFTLETDHRNLVYMDRSICPKVIRWRLRLQVYRFTVVHIPGDTNLIADQLSRAFICKRREVFLAVTRGHSKKANGSPEVTESETVLGKRSRRSRSHKDTTQRTSQDSSSPEGLAENDSSMEVMPRTSALALAERMQAIRPVDINNTISAEAIALLSPKERFDICHNEIVGHLGVLQTKGRLRRAGMLWKGCDKDIKRFTQECAVCQKTRLRQPEVLPALAVTSTWKAFKRIAIDHLTVVGDKFGNCNIIVCVDTFTRFVELFPAPDYSENSVALCLIS